MSEEKKCPICGEPTYLVYGKHPRKDGLCSKCSKLAQNGEVQQCPYCGTWNKTDKDCKCKQSSKKQKKETIKEEKTVEELTCIICGEPSNGKPQCKDCYYEMIDFKDSLDRNSKAFELKDYYYNLKSNIYRMKTFDYVKSNCNKLLAIAISLKELYRDESLTDRVYNETRDIIQSKKPTENKETTAYIKTQDTHKEEIIRTNDGHYVKSDPESVIDDILYDLRIVHCYEKKVPIDADEQTVTCDWFIPVTDNRHGIYIEYWGMNTESYKKNKERKRKAYKEHEIPLIEIEKDEYKDKQGLSDRIVSEINALAKKYFRISDFIK